MKVKKLLKKVKDKNTRFSFPDELDTEFSYGKTKIPKWIMKRKVAQLWVNYVESNTLSIELKPLPKGGDEK